MDNMIAKHDMYFLKAVSDFVPVRSEWIEVDYDMFTQAERASGFHSFAHSGGGTATASFSTGNLEGRVVYKDMAIPKNAVLIKSTAIKENTDE